MKTIYIVTGIFGHLGNTIAKMLLDNGEIVRGLALANDKMPQSLQHENLTIFRGDVRSKASIEPLFCNTTDERLIVVHTAGIVSIASKETTLLREVNVWGTQNIIDLCIKYTVNRLVYVSSVHAIPEKPNGQTIAETTCFSVQNVEGGYAKTKAEATRRVLQAAQNGLNAVVVHPSGIIGPGDYGNAHLTQLIMDYLDGRLTACVDGAYDFVDVRDVANGCLLATQKGDSGECYILSGARYPIPTLLNFLSKVSNKKPITTILPFWFADFTAPLAETYYKLRKQPPLYTKYSMYTLKSNSNFSNDKAIKQLGYTVTPIEKTLSDTIHWLCQNGRLKNYHQR